MVTQAFNPNTWQMPRAHWLVSWTVRDPVTKGEQTTPKEQHMTPDTIWPLHTCAHESTKVQMLNRAYSRKKDRTDIVS